MTSCHEFEYAKTGPSKAQTTTTPTAVAKAGVIRLTEVLAAVDANPARRHVESRPVHKLSPAQQKRPRVRDLFDGRYWARTSDLLLVEQALSQLS